MVGSCGWASLEPFNSCRVCNLGCLPLHAVPNCIVVPGKILMVSPGERRDVTWLTPLPCQPANEALAAHMRSGKARQNANKKNLKHSQTMGSLSVLAYGLPRFLPLAMCSSGAPKCTSAYEDCKSSNARFSNIRNTKGVDASSRLAKQIKNV